MQKNAHSISNFQLIFSFVSYEFQTKVKYYVTNGKEGEAVPPHLKLVHMDGVSTA